MEKSRVLALAGLQVMLFIILMLLNPQSTGIDFLKYNLIGYAAVQLYIHWGLWEKKESEEEKE
jgi:hypothetical protein